LAALLAVLGLVCFTIARRPRAPIVTPTVDPVDPAPQKVDPVTVEADHTIGAGTSFGGLTVFPVLAKDQPDLGRFVTLDQALEKKAAVVRETDASGSVNTLVIENKGDEGIFVLAGTVVKGGKQDRQIAQDFAIGPKQTLAVDAFCVEPHRWDASRQGVATQNRFGTYKTMATSGVRAAGQYKKNQLEVWSKVGEVNQQNGKRSATGSLAASLEDGEIAAAQLALAKKVGAFLDGVDPQREVVGMAYAVEGKVRGVRWFANHALYGLYREALFNTAALEAITAERASAGKPKSAAPPLTPEAVKAFIDDIDRAQVNEERPTLGDNVNHYKESKMGYGSSSTLKGASTASPSEKRAKKATISRDFTAK
jgi:hypothetical protein